MFSRKILPRHSICNIVSKLVPNNFQPSSTHKLTNCRYLSSENLQNLKCHKLTDRGLIKASGKDTSAFLQGLVTNDMACLDKKCDIKSVFTLLLNLQGRILYDMIIYKLETETNDTNNSYLIECDKEIVADLISTVKRYKMRKKVDIVNVSDEMDAWAVCPDTLLETEAITPIEISDGKADHVIVHCVDPRVKSFGSRMILPHDVDVQKVVLNSSHGSTAKYHTRRYRFGLAEGITDMPPGNSLPLECNAAFMNGVSFDKGCYIGQELTARTQHTGVIRKRLMPIQLHGDAHNCQPGYTVENLRGKNCGKMRGSEGQDGLALLRVGEALGCELSVKDDSNITVATLTTWVPQWWPRETDEIVKKALHHLKDNDGNE